VCPNLLLVEIQALACEWAEDLEVLLLLETVTANDHHPQHKARSRHPRCRGGRLRHLEAGDEYHPQSRPCPRKRVSFLPQPRLNLHLTAVEPG